MTVNVMSGNLGDIFWDLAGWLTYSSGYDIGCNIYVANPTDTEKEYALMAKLVRNGTALTEEALPVFGYTWFKVAPGDFITLKGALRFSESDADLTVSLYEKESGEITDTVTTGLVATSSSALPPAWPGSTGTSSFDWSSLLGILLPMMLVGIAAINMARTGQETSKTAGAKSETKTVKQGSAI